MRDARVAVIGATGAVGTVTMRILRERGFENVRAFRLGAVGRVVAGRGNGRSKRRRPTRWQPAASTSRCSRCGTAASRELVPHAVRGGAVAIDKSSAYRLEPGIPLVVPEVNGDRVAEASEGNPCRQSELLHDPARLRAQAAARRGRSPAGCASPPTRPPRARGAARRAEGAEAPTGRAQHDVGFRLGVGGRRDGRGGEDPRRDAEGPRAAGAAAQRDHRARARARRPRRVRLDRASRNELTPRTGRASCSRDAPVGAFGRRADAGPRRPRPTTCSSAGCGADRAGARTGSSCSLPATTSTKAPR